MKYKIITTKEFDSQFKNLDKAVQKIVFKWIINRLIDTENPGAYGKPLKANLKGYWRYRIGNYRMITEIRDKELVIVAISIAHRKESY